MGWSSGSEAVAMMSPSDERMLLSGVRERTQLELVDRHDFRSGAVT